MRDGLQYDPAQALRELRAADPALGPVFDAVAFSLQVEPLHSPFFALARSIVYQQLSGKAAATILARVVALVHPNHFPGPEEILAADPEALRAAGLSRNKLAALQDLARRTLDGTVPDLATLEAMDDEEIIDRLTAVRGVGRWTVEMLLLFRLGRPDVLPSTDLGVRKGLGRLLGSAEPPTAREVADYGERWRPWCSVASWYMWRLTELPDFEPAVPTGT